MRIITLPGVFQPRSDSWMLVDAVRRATLHSRTAALDLCSGSGAVAVAAALRGARSVPAGGRASPPSPARPPLRHGGRRAPPLGLDSPAERTDQRRARAGFARRSLR